MRRSSSTWLFSAALLLLAAGRPAAARPTVCFPPLFDGGQRLHQMPAPRVYWLELLMRQHEICWRHPARPDELRVVLAGNSAMFGFPLPADQTFGALLNQDFTAHGVPAHVFNLAYVNTYQLKDAVILHEALRYDPDVIVYPVTLAEFVHVAPIIWPSLIQFFASNSGVVSSFLKDPPAGLEAPFEAYRSVTEHRRPEETRFARLQEAGLYLRITVAQNARWLGRRLGASIPDDPSPRTAGRQLQYDCSATERDFKNTYADWERWNILAYLEEIKRTRGIEVVVVNWPVAHEPVDGCYNVRYPADAFARYSAWLRDESAARGLRYVDLHDLLPADQFLDSLHVSAEGHRRVAEKLDTVLAPMLVDLAQHHAAVAATR